MKPTGLFGRRREPSTENGSDAEVQRVYQWLTPGLQTTLAGLSDCPDAVAEAVFQLLPFGSRAALAEMKLARFPEKLSAEGKLEPDVSEPVVLTPLAFAVMRYAAAQLEADPEGVALSLIHI